MKTYKEMQQKEVLFKVRGENETNKIINKVTPKLLKVFEGLEEQTILKSGYSVTYGRLYKKYEDKTDLILREFEDKFKTEDITPILYLNVSEYSIYLNVKLRFNKLDDKGFLYYENQKYLFNLSEGKIKETYKINKLEEINEEEQIKIFDNCLELKKSYEEEKQKLKPYSLRELIK